MGLNPDYYIKDFIHCGTGALTKLIFLFQRKVYGQFLLIIPDCTMYKVTLNPLSLTQALPHSTLGKFKYAGRHQVKAIYMPYDAV